MDDLLTMLQLGCNIQLDKRQAVRLGTLISDLKNQVSTKQLEIDHCHAVCDELRQKLDQMKSLATAGANCAIAAAQDGIDLVRENEALVAQVENLSYHIANVALAAENNSGYEPSLSVFHRAIDEAQDAVEILPATCLAQIKADAVKGFAKEVFDTGELSFKSSDFVVDFASHYAERLLDGGQ